MYVCMYSMYITFGRFCCKLKPTITYSILGSVNSENMKQATCALSMLDAL